MGSDHCDAGLGTVRNSRWLSGTFCRLVQIGDLAALLKDIFGGSSSVGKPFRTTLEAGYRFDWVTRHDRAAGDHASSSAVDIASLVHSLYFLLVSPNSADSTGTFRMPFLCMLKIIRI